MTPESIHRRLWRSSRAHRRVHVRLYCDDTIITGRVVKLTMSVVTIADVEACGCTLEIDLRAIEQAWLDGAPPPPAPPRREID